MPADRLSDYDEAVLRELHAWKHPRLTVRGRWGNRVERVIEHLMNLVPTRLVEHALRWILPRMRHATWRATSEPMVLRAYRRAGATLEGIDEIAHLDLRLVDEVAGNKRLHEGALGGVEGASAGFFGGWALAADIAAVTLLSMRAVQSRGLVYGFDPSDEAELDFVLHVLDAASRLGPTSKGGARTSVSLLGSQVGKRTLTANALERVVRRLPGRLVTRFAAMKSESAVPILGAVTSGGFNSWYLQAVTHTARMAYRERFLRRKYGDGLLAAYGC
jgi:hypothetical protein